MGNYVRSCGFVFRSLLTLKLNLVLHDQSLLLVVDLVELGRDGMVSSGVLEHKTLVTLNASILERLLNSPFADVSPFLWLFVVRLCLGILLSMRRLPSLLPVVCELFEEGGFDGGRLFGRKERLAVFAKRELWGLTAGSQKHPNNQISVIVNLR